MVRKINRLSARTVAALTKPGRHADGGGLYLRVDDNGAKRWVFMWERSAGGKRVQREAGLGSVLSTPLARAREKAAECRALLADGIAIHFMQERPPLRRVRGAGRLAKSRKPFLRQTKKLGATQSTGRNGA